MPKSSCLKWTYGRPGIDYTIILNYYLKILFDITALKR